MTFLVLKFLHVGSMFLATVLAVGPSVLLYLIARSSDVGAIRRAFGHVTTVFRAGGALYGLGLLFGFAAALTGQLDLTQPWLVTAYVLVGVLIATNLVFERWTRRIVESVGTSDHEPSAELPQVVRARAPLYSLAAMVTLTLMIVFVMVVKPTLFV
jgi:hypothetical protein